MTAISDKILQNDFFGVVQLLDHPQELEKTCDWLLEHPEETRCHIRLAEFVANCYRSHLPQDDEKGKRLTAQLYDFKNSHKRWIAPVPPGSSDPIDPTDPLWDCLKKLREHGILVTVSEKSTYDAIFQECTQQIKQLPREHPLKREFQQKFESLWKEAVKKTVQLLKSKASLFTIYAYLGEERQNIALSCFQADFRHFGKRRNDIRVSKITYLAETKEIGANYHERVLQQVPIGKNDVDSKIVLDLNPTDFDGITFNNDLVDTYNPYNRPVPLTSLCVTRQHVKRLIHEDFAGASPGCSYPRATIIHPEPWALGYIDARVEKVFQKACGQHIPRHEVPKAIGEFGWLEFTALRWDRGTATIVEIFLTSLCEASGFRLRLDRLIAQGKRLDMEALTQEQEKFMPVFLSIVEDTHL